MRVQDTVRRGWAAARQEASRAWRAAIVFLTLPDEISDLERSHLERLHRLLGAVLAAHVPVVAVVAAIAGTSVAGAVVWTTSVGLIGLGARRFLVHPRHRTWALGAALSVHGALLAHFGGPGEANLHPFLAVPLVAISADPVAVLVSAAIVYAGQPFTLDAPALATLAHLGWLGGISLAAIAAARGAFDLVHQLQGAVADAERGLARRDHELQTVLDTVRQGVMVVDADGSIRPGYSATLVDWLGPPSAGQRVWDYFAAHEPGFGRWLDLGWQVLNEDVLPIDLALDQLPKRLIARDRSLALSYTPVGQQIVMVVDDVTADVGLEAAEALQHETLVAVQHLLRDRNGFAECCDEIDRRVRQLTAVPPVLRPVEVHRTLHLVKGTAALVGLSGVANACERVEDRCRETGEHPADRDLDGIAAVWRRTQARMASLVDLGRPFVEAGELEYNELLDAIRTHRSDAERMLASWRLEPAKKAFQRLESHARALARRLRLGDVYVEVSDGGVRLDREATAPFWASLVHVVRNAVDHGLRAAAGPRQLTMTARVVHDGAIEIAIADSGPGIRWDRVASAAAARGLPISTRRALIDALFAERLSTRDEASDISGHGMGLAAVRAACDVHGIERRVVSEPNQGTRFIFLLPAAMAGAVPVELRALAS